VIALNPKILEEKGVTGAEARFYGYPAITLEI